MHSLSIIKRLNQEKQDRFEGKVIEKSEIEKDFERLTLQNKTESRQLFFRELRKRQSEED